MLLAICSFIIVGLVLLPEIPVDDKGKEIMGDDDK